MSNFPIYYKPVKQPIDFIKPLEWCAVCFSLTGSACLAMLMPIFGYIFFIIGSSLFLITSRKQKQEAIFFINSAFLVLNVIGLINNLQIFTK